MAYSSTANPRDTMNNNVKTISALALLSVLIISVCGCAADSSASKLSFTGGWSHPSDITALLKEGPVLLYFGGNCKSCAEMKVTISNLESKYNGSGVTIRRVDTSNDTTHKVPIYGISSIPATIVIRSDGAVAKSIGTTDEQILINTIEDARQWK